MVQRPRPPPPARSTPRCAPSSTGWRTRRCSASPTRRRSSWPRAWSSIAPDGPEPRLLLRLRLDRRRDRAEDGVPVLAAPARRAASARSSSACATPTTATRSARCRVGGIDLFHSLYRPLLFDAPPGRARRRRGAGARSSTSTASEIAAVIVEPLVQGAAGMLVQPAGLPARGARALRRARRLADLRRGRHRLRPHRHDVRLRAGGRHARLHVPRPRASPAATCRSPRRSRPSAIYEAFLGEYARSSRRSSTATPTRATRWPARRASPRSTSSRASTRSSACSRRSPCSPTCWTATSRRYPASPRSASAASWSASSSPSSRSTRGSATRSRSPPAGAARSSGRWATSSCSCRRCRSPRPELRRLVEITAAAIAEATATASANAGAAADVAAAELPRAA